MCLPYINFLILVQAEITDKVCDELENETNSVTFSCQATGEPVPAIIWYFNGILINVSDTSKYKISSSLNGVAITSFLKIVNTRSFDVGTYTCHAENFIGIDKSSGILTINGKYVCTHCMVIRIVGIML